MAKSLPLIVLGATSAGTCLFVKSLSNLLIDLLAASLLFETASAATVSWIATGYVDDPGDVSTNGILAGALCVGAGTTAQTINGVPFNSDPGGNAPVGNGWLSFAFNYLNGTNATFWSGPDPGDSAAYNFALASARFGGVSVQVTISGLDAGNNYEIQIWAVDTRSNQSLLDRTGTFAAGNSVTLTYGGMLASTPGPQWALGTFTADSTSLTLTNVAEVPQLNLIQIRDTTPPPAAPSTAPFNILRATLTPPGELMLTWKSLSNAIYMVQGVDGLSAASWQTDLSNVVSQGAVTSVALPFSPTNSRRLLRVARDFSGAYYRVPSTNLNLVLAAPISTWDEGVPLGNGLLGGLLWGQTNLIRLSLDRGDLWDERPASGFTSNNFNYATMKSLVAAGSNDQFNAIFDSPYNDVHPTKIPAGRLEITLDPTQQLKFFELNLATAEGRARFTQGTPLEVFFSAAQCVALMRIPVPVPVNWQLLAPASLSQLGYPDASTGSLGGTQWFLQQAANGLSYCVCIGSRHTSTATLLAATVTSTTDSADPVQLARDRVATALAAGYDAMLEPHINWWNAFWQQSSVSVPELPMLREYYLVRYFYGAASRRGAPPMPLQGVWTADAGSLPPWKGDYHNDLNTQMTYIGYPGAGQFDEGSCYLDFLWNLLPAFRAFATNFYGAPGAAVPGVMSLAGQPLGGWGQYSLSPTMGAWSGHLFYLHWRYTGDDQFLTNRALPWCREVGQCLRSLLVADSNRVLKLPLSTSPEIDNNSATSWLSPNSNYDYFCLKMLFLALQEMASAAGLPTEAAQWGGAAAALGGYHTNGEGALKLDSVRDLTYSHRHLANLIGLYPFNLLSVDGGDNETNTIAASLRQWDNLGTSGWVGYSFAWMSCLRARVGQAESALRNLDIFTKAFILRNGFHANGDQTASGFSDLTYRPFTLEGNFLGMQAIHEMLLQSWNNTPGSGDPGVIRLFPATGWRWHDASFADLRAEGGHKVSGIRQNNATTWFRIVTGRDGLVKIRDNFGGRVPSWNRGGVTKVGSDFHVSLLQGEVIEATLDKPAEVPPAPLDLAVPVVIASPTTRLW